MTRWLLGCATLAALTVALARPAAAQTTILYTDTITMPERTLQAGAPEKKP